MDDDLRHHLTERVKELTALHGIARLLGDASRAHDAVMSDVVAMLPPAWQYPGVTRARITLAAESWGTPGFTPTPWMQRESFRLRDGSSGEVEIAYAEERPPADEGPFLREERDLIRSVAELVRNDWQERRDSEVILRANEKLEAQVAERTAALSRLASELCLAEARERRAIAEDLHDHLGQSLAFVRARLRQLAGDVVFGGHGAALEELQALLDQAIRYTRGLTFEVSPPVLYELGLGPALEWLGEEFARKHGIAVEVRDRCRRDLPDDLRVIFFRSGRELLRNVAAHAQARRVRIEIASRDDTIELTVADDGRGFDPPAEGAGGPAPREQGGFGLFSIRERVRQLGGEFRLDSAPGQGTRVHLSAPTGRAMHVRATADPS